MTGEIKFRGWDERNKKMVGNEDALNFLAYFVKVVKYMRYTGRKDKNDVEIYEGDIVKSPGIDNAMVVKYADIQSSDDMTAPGIGFQFNTNPQYMEIVGNIYQSTDDQKKKWGIEE